MKKVKEIRIISTEAVGLANHLARLEQRRVHDSATRLFIRAARSKIAHLKRKKKTA